MAKIYDGIGNNTHPETTFDDVVNGSESLADYIAKQGNAYMPKVADIYAQAVDDAVSKVKALQNNEAIEVSTFIAFTDCHYTSQSELDRMLTAIEHINGALNADYVANLGDSANDDATAYKRIVNKIISKSFRWIILQGNHDRYAPILQRRFLTNIPLSCYAPKSASFYMDDHRHRVRYICLSLHEKGAYLDSNTPLNTNNYVGIGYSQFKWLADEALKTMYRVVLLSHETLTRTSTGTEYWMSAPYSNYLKIKNLFQAFINGTSGTISLTLQDDEVGAQNSIQYDFTEQGAGRVLFSIHGHIHGDADYNNGMWHEIWVESALYTQDVWAGTNAPKTLGTDEEVSFDIVTIDYTNEQVHLTRFGAGDDRIIDMNA